MADRWLYAWALGSISFGGASLLVPLYVVQLGGTAVDLGILAATATGVGAPGALLFGRLANRVGHRRPLVVVTLATVAGTLAVTSLLERIAAVIVANAVLWFVVASVTPVLTMLVVDDAPETAWGERIGRLNKYQGYGWAGGLVLGTAWPLVGPALVGTTTVTRDLFWLFALCAAGSVVGAARWLPRPDPDAHVTSERKVRRIGRLLSTSNRGIRTATFAFSPNRLYWTTRSLDPRRLRARLDARLSTYLVATGLFFTGFAAFWAPLPLFLTDAGFDSGRVFALYLASSLGSAVLYQRAGSLAAEYDPTLLQSTALAVRGLLFPAVAFLGVVGTAALGFGLSLVALTGIGLTWAVILVVGTAIVTRLAPAASGASSGGGSQDSATPSPSASRVGSSSSARDSSSRSAADSGDHQYLFPRSRQFNL
jgi:MFS family permease